MPLTFPQLAVSDFTKLPVEILIDLINFSNGTALPPDMLTFGEPTELTVGAHNTTVVGTAKPGAYYTGSVTLTYNRVDLETIPGVRSTTFEIGNATTIADLVEKINAAYQLNLQPEDFVDAELPTLSDPVSNQEMPFDLVAGPKSLIYRNKVTLNVYRADVALSSVIVNTVLSGLIYRQPDEL